jgi:hypothetical protein
MAWENQMALDMILAEKGVGVCALIGGECTALEGTITKALQGLTALSNNCLRIQR